MVWVRRKAAPIRRSLLALDTEQNRWATGQPRAFPPLSHHLKELEASGIADALRDTVGRSPEEQWSGFVWELASQ